MGPSKTESLSGFRLGVGYGNPEIITRMEKLQAVVSLRCAGYCQAAFLNRISEPENRTHAKIGDIVSEYLYEQLGEPAIGARAAVGVASLPGEAPVEVQMVTAVK